MERRSGTYEHDALVRDNNHQGVDFHNVAVGPTGAVDALAHKAFEHDALVRDNNHQGIDFHNAAVDPGGAVDLDVLVRDNHQGVDFHNVAVGPGYMKCEYV